MKNASVLIYGPQGCGKTLNAKALAAHYGLANIVDEMDMLAARESWQSFGTLYLSTDRPFTFPGRRVSFNTAMREMQLADAERR